MSPNEKLSGESETAPLPASLGTAKTIKWIVAIVFLCGLSAVLGWAINGVDDGFWAPLFSNGVQWVVCLGHAYPQQTEK